MPLESATQESRNNEFLENKIMSFLRTTFLNDSRFYRLSSLSRKSIRRIKVNPVPAYSGM